MDRVARIAWRMMAVAALLLLGMPVRSEADSPRLFPRISISTPGASGPAAVAALGSNLPAVAAFYGKTAEQLRQQLLGNSTLRVSRTGRLYQSSPQASGSVTQLSAATAFSMPWAGGTTAPLDQTFALHSNPTASKTIYLNFIGKTMTADSHQIFSEIGLSGIVVPPFSIDATAAFSDPELRIIQEIWQRVAEDFAPFDVDVTTAPVTQDRITRTDASDPAYGIDVLFALRTTQWDCPICADSTYPAAFFDQNDDSYKPAIVFHLGSEIGARLLADAASRAVGFTLGLVYDGTSATDYYAGQGDSPVNGWAPIMGGLSDRPLRQFDNGEYNDTNNDEQDDFAVIIGNGLTLRADEAGNTVAAASWLPVESSGGRSAASFDGVITSQADADVFSLQAAAGLIDVRVDPAAVGPNADLTLTLLNAAGDIVESSSPTQNLSAAINRQITTPGRYYLEVKGSGDGDPKTTGYSSYGSVGAFSLTGSFATPANSLPSAIFTALPASGPVPLAVTFNASASSDDGQIKRYRWDFGDGTSREAATSAPVDKTYGTPGSYTVTLQVTDDTGLSATASRTVTATASTTPQPPVAAFTASTTSGVAPLQVTVNASGSSDDGLITTYRWEWGDGTSQQGASPGPASKTYTAPGSYTITLRVTDDAGLTTSTTRAVTVTAAPQQPPVAAFTASTTSGVAPLQVTVNASGSTDDGQITTYRWEWGDGTSQQGASPGPASKTYTAPGNYTITLRVTDDAGLTTSTTRAVTVTAAPQQPPVAAFTASATSGAAPLQVTVNASGSSDDGQIATYRWEWGDGTSQQGASPGPASKTYTAPGSYTITLRVTDDAGLTTSTTRAVTVTAAPQQPPVADFTASPTSGVAPLQVTVNASGSSDDGQITTYRWEWGDGTSQQGASPGPSSKTYTAPGSYTITLRVTDDAGLTTSTTRAVTVTAAPQQPPVAAFTASPTTGAAPLQVTVNASGSSDDGLIATYRWEWGDGTSQQGASPGPASKTYTAPGSYTITLRVTDDAGLTTSTTRAVTVTAAPQQPPVAAFTASATSGTAPLQVTVNASGSTDDGQITTYRWEWGDGTSQQGASPGPVSKTYTAPGSYTITLRVTDDAGLTTSTTRAVTVTAAPQQPPVAAFTASPTTGAAPLQVTVNASGSTDDGQITTYRWEWGDGTSQQGASPGPVSKTYTAPGSYTITLRVTDDDDLTSSVTRTVTVTAAPQPPVADFTASPTSGVAPLQVTVDASASTDDGLIGTYRWEWGDGTSQQGPSPGPVSKTYTAPGSYTITLRVTDDAGLTATATRAITVRGETSAGVPRVSDVSVIFASGGRNRVKGRATATVVDANGQLASGATVIAKWSGPVGAVSWARTGRTGKVNLTSPSTAASGCVRLTVVAVRLGNGTYPADPPVYGEVCR